MKSTLYVGGSVFMVALAIAQECAADDLYDAPLLGVTAAFGARSGWGGADAAIIGAGLVAGERWGGWRAGLLGDASWWRANPGVAIDFGGFVSGDVAAIWLDSALSAAWFVRGEPALRWVSSTSRWAFAPALATGVRVAGIEMGIVGRPELGLEDVPSGSRIGIDVEWRLGLDLVEITRLSQHIGDSNQPLAP